MNKSAQREATLLQAQREIGVTFIGTLLVSLVAVVGAITWPYILSPSSLTGAEGAAAEKVTLLALLVGSAVAFVLTGVAATRLVRGRYKRSWKSLTLTAAAALSALPGLFIGSFSVAGFVYSLLPLTLAELRVIDVAERFVERNGYTAAGHPTDLPVLANDIVDGMAGSIERVLESRRGTLQAKAFGIRSAGSDFLIFFESIPPNTGGAYRTVEVDDEGHARILHQDTFPGLYKRTKR